MDPLFGGQSAEWWVVALIVIGVLAVGAGVLLAYRAIAARRHSKGRN